jgi:Tfp pilus assembly ATPase PilU
VLRQDPDVIMIGEMRDAISFRRPLTRPIPAISFFNAAHRQLFAVHHAHPGFLQGGRPRAGAAPACRHAASRHYQRMVQTVTGAITVAQEVLINTGTVRKIIEENRLDKLPAAIETGQDEGMQSFNQGLFNLVKEGKITEKEGMAKATNPQSLEMMFKGIFLDESRRILG